jgi:DNA polymerase elongation subunit (family B)
MLYPSSKFCRIKSPVSFQMSSSSNMTTPLVFYLTSICSREQLVTLEDNNRRPLTSSNSPYLAHVPDQPTVYDPDDPFGPSEEDEHKHKSHFPEIPENAHTTVCLFGKTKEGYNVVAHVKYAPFLMIRVPEKWKTQEIKHFVRDVAQWIRLSPLEVGCKVEMRKKCYGWEPGPDGVSTAQHKILRLSFPSEQKLRFAGAIIRKKTKYYQGANGPFSFDVWESKIQASDKFRDETSIVPSGWVELKQYTQTRHPAAYADIEVEVADYTTAIPRPDIRDMAPLVVASIDIECYNATGEFPQAGKDPIIGIGTSVKRFGQDALEQHYFALQDTKVKDGSKVVVHFYLNQSDLMFAWRDWFMQLNPDVVVGYNIMGFDFHFMSETVKNVTQNRPHRWFFLSRLWAEHTPLVSKDFQSAAYGQRTFHNFNMTGRLVLDVMEIVRREKKLRSYKLDDVAFKFLKQKKFDLPPKEIFKKYEGTAEDRGVIADYCAQDCDLVIHLMLKLNILQNIFEMSKVTLTSAQDIVSKGQQVKVFNQIVWYGHREGFVINDHEDIAKDSYEGAKVLEPKPGYYSECITTLDFASLYPSIMIQHNLCCSTWVKNPAHQALKGPKYLHVDVGARKYCFVQHIMGIMPKILKTLLAARKAVRKQMPQYEKTDPFKYSLMDAEQLALKLSCNSIYGFCGTGFKGMYPCLPVSESTTYFGRIMIMRLKQTIEEKYPGSEVIYGDSVVGNTPILVKNAKGQFAIMPISQLANFEQESKEGLGNAKEYVLMRDRGLQVWTDEGWTLIENVMRHKTNKPIYRVATRSGIVDVTADHSLLTSKGDCVSPLDLKKDATLLHSLPPFFQIPHTNDIKMKVAWLHGFQMARGAGAAVDPEVLNGSLQIQQSFLSGLCAESEADDKLLVCGAVAAMGVFFIAYNLGYLITVTENPDKADQYSLAFQQKALSYIDAQGVVRNPHEQFDDQIYTQGVVSVTKLHEQYDDYVYDLTTKNHKFQAGVGSMIVHNTDSVMIKFPLPDDISSVAESFRLGNEVCVLAHEMFGESISLTMEKVFRGYILLKKKRYAGLMYTDPDAQPKVKLSGVEAVRRDFAIMVCNTQERVIDALLLDRDVNKAKKIIQDKLDDLVHDRIPFEEYMLSCQLKKTYKNPNQAQLILVNRIKARAPGSEPKSGDRIHYVVMQIKERDAPMYKKVEEANFAREQKLPLDRVHYLENQLERPLSVLMEAFLPNPKSIFDETRIRLTNNRDGLQDIRHFIKKRPREDGNDKVPSIPVPAPIEHVDMSKIKRKRGAAKTVDDKQPSLKGWRKPTAS